MRTSYDTGHNFIFLIHLRPTFVHSWKDFEAPKFVISERTKLWKFELCPLVSLILLLHEFDHPLLSAAFVLFGGDFLGRRRLNGDGHHYIFSGRHKNRRLCPLTRYDGRSCKVVIIDSQRI